jgi:hypothetical protein
MTISADQVSRIAKLICYGQDAPKKRSPQPGRDDCEAMVDEEFFFFFCSCQENRSVTAKPIQFIFI